MVRTDKVSIGVIPITNVAIMSYLMAIVTDPEDIWALCSVLVSFLIVEGSVS